MSESNERGDHPPRPGANGDTEEQRSPADFSPGPAPVTVPPPPRDEAPRRRISPKSPKQALQPEQAPPPPPRSKKARHPVVVVLNFFIMAVVLGIIALGGALYMGKREFTEPGPLSEPRSVLISRGADVDTIASLLKRQNVIDSDLVFTVAVRLNKAGDKLKAGEYLFQPGVSMEQVLDDIVTGRSVLHAITVPEGLTSEQIIARVASDTVLVGDVPEVPPEGTLLPETYKFTRGATRQQIVEQMKSAHARAVEEIWARRAPDLPIENQQEFVTLASIVEKETGRADERPRVASVFINRLRENMRLQSDPTIIYGIFGGKGKPSDRPIYRSDLTNENPYNTYVVDGLPPTPIANPGRAALEAVANPSRTKDLYFVADGSGGHVFAETLDDHNRNVARWRRIEAAAQEAAQAAAAAREQEPEGGAPDTASP